jgi:hypothetical protein
VSLASTFLDGNPEGEWFSMGTPQGFQSDLKVVLIGASHGAKCLVEHGYASELNIY